MKPAKLLFLLVLGSQALLQGQTYRFHTNLGDIDVAMRPDVAPLTVGNFQTYLSQGTYTGTIFHRSVPGFVIQGGGYQLSGSSPQLSPQNAPVANEFKLSNIRGTIAMALSGTDINSGTDQWFFNLADNSGSLDSQKFTVFGAITGCSGLAVMDRIAGVPVLNGGSPFDQIPLINYKTGLVKAANFVQVTSIEPTPAGTTPTLVNAASYTCAGVAPGDLITVYGDNIGPSQLTTKVVDASGVVTSNLAGTRVLFDGTPGPMLYTSTKQASVIVPYNVAGKTNVSVTVEYQGNSTAPVVIPVLATDPGIFTQDSSGTGDGSIVRPDYSLVSKSSPAKAGDVLILFGHGYGAVTAASSVADGAIVGSTYPVPAAATTVLIDGQGVTPQYAGGAPYLVNGVMQVNFQVPAGLADGSHTIQLQIGNGVSPATVNLQTLTP